MAHSKSQKGQQVKHIFFFLVVFVLSFPFTPRRANNPYGKKEKKKSPSSGYRGFGGFFFSTLVSSSYR